ncbi:MAG: gliding motility-associated C-terminal domain-containing protein [Phaeodactylibacter sp.]|nr:gliding motility-associated C-terminal domain-containing protein [Phaeodactylibacter sp.]
MITLSDALPPVINPPPVDVVINCSGALPPAVPLAATDNCDPSVAATGMPVDDNSGLNACGLGTIVRRWAATDCSGNTAIVSQSITLVDATPPAISQPIPPDVLLDCSGPLPPGVPLAASDDCDASVVITDPPVDDLSGLDACGAGTIVRSWAVTDCSGNTTVATQSITRIDQDAPLIVDQAPADIVVDCDVMPPAAPLGAFDYCDGNITSTGLPVDDLSGLDACGVGEVIRSWTVTDCSGNITTISQTITLVDNTPPTLAIPADGTFDCNNIPSASVADATATDNCSAPLVVYDGETIVGSGCPYEIHRSWTATDACGNSATLAQVITVQDSEAPVFMNTPVDITACEGALPPMINLNWVDNCDGSGSVGGVDTSDGMSNPETISRIWSYTDACGNTASYTQTITVTAAPSVDAGADRTLCEGEQLSLSATTTGGVDTTFWISTGDGSFDDASNPNAIYTPGNNDLASGQVTLFLSVLYSGANCLPATDTVVATFVPLPAVDAGPGQEITCGAPTVVLGNSMGGGNLLYEWSGPGIDDTNRYSPQPEVGAPGVYTLTVSTTGNSCIVSDTVVVSTDTGFPVAAAGGGQMINCLQTSVTLNGSGSSTGGDFTYNWSGPGIGTSNQNELNPVVTEPGLYTLSVSNTTNGCTAADEVEILLDTLPPSADAGPQQMIDCDNASVILNGSNVSNGPGIVYQWQAPDGSLLGADSSQIATEGGVYSFTVTDTINGCSAMAMVEVLIDTIPPAADAGPGRTLTCEESSFTLAAGPGPGLVYEWAREGVWISNDDTLTLSEPGIYTLMATDTTNGCINTDEIIVTENTITPVADAGAGGLLTCTANCFGLGGAGTSAGPDITYQWTGISNAVTDSNIPYPEVCAPDTYTLLVTDTANGCTATDTVVVTEDSSLPTAMAMSNDTLSCEVSAVALSGVGSSIGVEIEYEWRNGAGQLVSGDIGTMVSSPGLYSLTVINTQTQCRSISTINVPIDTLSPLAIAGADVALDCANPEIELSGGSGPQPGILLEWKDEGGNSLGSGTGLLVSEPGLYTLLVTNTNNGCTATDEVVVSDNANYPSADAGGGDTLTCSSPTAILGGNGSSSGANFIYSWTGPGFISGLPNPSVSVGGSYFLMVTDTSNFCMAVDSAEVSVDTIAPATDAGPDALLTCTAASALLDGSGSAQGSSLAYEWVDTSGIVLNNGPALLADIPGTYVLRITNTQNGCTATDEAVVAIDTIGPVAVAGVNGVLSCTQTLLELDGTGSDTGSNYSYQWYGPGLAGDSTLLVVEATVPGLYTLEVTNTENGCVAYDSVEATQDVEPPTAFAGTAQELTCQVIFVTLQGSASVPGAQFLWSGPGIDEANESLPNPAIDQPGLYSLSVTDPATGCTSTAATVSVADHRQLPVAEAIATDSLDCRTLSVLLDGGNSAQGDTILYQWYFEGQVINGATMTEWMVDAPGEYILEVRNSITACVSTDTVSVATNMVIPPVQIEGVATLNCYDPVGELVETAAAGLPNLAFEWETVGGSITSSNLDEEMVEVDAAGWYIVTVRNLDNGCEGADTVRVEEDFEQPLFVLEDSYRLNCEDQSVVFEPAFTPDASELSFVWSGPGFSAVTPAVTVSQPGAYSLTATLLRSGCQATGNTSVLESLGIDSIVAEVIPPVCFGNTGGLIRVGAVSGGSPPYLFALDGGPFTDGQEFGPLPPGSYMLAVQDGEGCEQEQLVSIPDGTLFEISLGGDIEIKLGDSVQLSVEPTHPISIYNWYGADSLSCGDCPAPVVSPSVTTVYTLIAGSQEGCQAEDAVTIFVSRREDIYVPTAFSPNGDGNNDDFTIYSGYESAWIRKLQVFDRWGSLLFETENIPAGAPGLGWDGRFRGSDMDIGVYVFLAELVMPDGQIELVKGEVMLLR